MAIGDPRGMDAEGNGGHVDPLADWGDMLFSRAGLGALVGVDIAFGGGEMVGAGWNLGGDVLSGASETAGGLFG